MKDKHRTFKPQIKKLSEQCVENEESIAPDKVTLETLYFGTIDKSSESLSKAPEVRTTDRLALTFGIGISALTMAMIYLSGAK